LGLRWPVARRRQNKARLAANGRLSFHEMGNHFAMWNFYHAAANQISHIEKNHSVLQN
jgi:hypothetical protein